MSRIRNWKGLETSPEEGQSVIHSTGWLNVTVKRASDQSRNVGVSAELDNDVTTFNIRARIDPLESKQASQTWLGLVEPHILLMMKKGDQWLTNKPNEGVTLYNVTSINGDEIILEKN